jgi:membrane-associated phospholipid phosphatase
MRAIALYGCFLASVLLAVPDTVRSADTPAAYTPRDAAWVVPGSELKSPPPADGAGELRELKTLMAKRSADELERARWWNVGGPAYRWNELAVEALLDQFVVLPMAARHLALLHTAIDDAVAAAWSDKTRHGRVRPSVADPSIAAALPVPTSKSYPSDVAAAAAAAASVLAHLLPDRKAEFLALAEEAMRSRVLTGVEYPSDLAAGRALGERAAALAIRHAATDGSDARWTGSVPQGPGKWQGTNPIGATAPAWRPWVLSRADEFRPSPPPAFDSEQTKLALAELKSFKRTPQTNHRATYWEVFGGARAFALWNDIARTKLLESAMVDPPASARALAALNIALLDSAIACWEAKFAYWYIRPSQLDAELKPVFPPPNHPSYPAAHGCLSTAAATVLAELFPRDRQRILAHGRQAAEARVWAGIHYRFDIEAGEDLGRKVAGKVMARAYASRSQ